MRTRVFVLVVLAAAAGAASAARVVAQDPPQVVTRRAESGRFVAVVTDRQTGESRELPLHDAVGAPPTVTAVAGAGRAVLVGQTNNGVQVTVVDVKGRVTASFDALEAVVSEGGRLVAYQHYVPRGEPRPKVAYGIFDALTGAGAPAGERQPRFFPTDDLAHARQSELFWVADRVLAFVDYANKEAAVIAVEFGANGRVIRTVRKPLDPDVLVRQDRSAFLDDPARALHGARIRRIDGDGLQLRLSFNNPVLTADRVDVTIW